MVDIDFVSSESDVPSQFNEGSEIRAGENKETSSLQMQVDSKDMIKSEDVTSQLDEPQNLSQGGNQENSFSNEMEAAINM